MDQYTAQPPDVSQQVPPSEPPPVQYPEGSPVKKFLPFGIIAVVALVILVGAFSLFAGSNAGKGGKTGVPTPTHRPTATPLPAPTVPLASPSPAASSSQVTPGKIGRIAFIKDGDIYHSDLGTYSLVVKNATPAADKLSWSPSGKYLAWRPKSATATPSAITVFNREENASFTIKPLRNTTGEVLDYAWSWDEKQLAILTRDDSYTVSLFSIATPSAPLTPLVARSTVLRQVLWTDKTAVMFTGEGGLTSIDTASGSAKVLVSGQNIQFAKVSPDGKKLLYSVGDSKKSDLYVAASDGTDSRLISSAPLRVDMGTTNLSPTLLVNGGFIPFAVWFPKGDRLLIGYHYLPNLPLVGIYNISEKSLRIIGPFALGKDDIMLDDLRLLGQRLNTTAGDVPSWQLSLFTLEDNANLSVVRVIPGASSPVFFAKDVNR